MKCLFIMLLIALLPAGAYAQPEALTPAIALQALKETTYESDDTRSARNAVVDVLRQAHGRYTERELDAFARELEQLIREGVEPQATNAALALILSSSEVFTGNYPFNYAILNMGLTRLSEICILKSCFLMKYCLCLYV